MQTQANRRTQRAVLGLALYEYPNRLSPQTLERQIGEGVEHATAVLVAVGLLSREGDGVAPTLAAVHFDWLEAS